MSVYLPRSAVRPTMRASSVASNRKAWPNGAATDGRPSSATSTPMPSVRPEMEAGLVTAFLQFALYGFGLVGADAEKMRLLAALQHRHAFSRKRPRDDRLGAAVGVARAFERPDDASHIVAVDLLRRPTERAPFFGDRLDIDDDPPVRLYAVAVDDGHKVVQLERCGRDRGLPCRAFLKLAIGELAEDPRAQAVEPDSERHSDGLSKPMAKRAADHLYSRRGIERAHVEPASVRTVGRKLGQRYDSDLGQRRPQRDRIVSGRQHEAIALAPTRRGGIGPHLVEVKGGKDISHAEP